MPLLGYKGRSKDQQQAPTPAIDEPPSCHNHCSVARHFNSILQVDSSTRHFSVPAICAVTKCYSNPEQRPLRATTRLAVFPHKQSHKASQRKAAAETLELDPSCPKSKTDKNNYINLTGMFTSFLTSKSQSVCYNGTLYPTPPNVVIEN